MALDNAQFIAELSVTDPPGTDPLSQGDDQIRTIKRATQQSFPNIDKAVTLTADQMNLAAIKNAANIFTVSGNSFLDTNFARKSIATQFTGWDFVNEGGFSRWSLLMLDTAVNDDDFVLFRRDAVGALLSSPFRVSLVTGILDFDQVPTVQGAPIWVAGELRMFASAQTPGTNWFKADGTNGTLNLSSRFLGGSGGNMGAVGTLLDPNLNATAVAGTVGGTAISSAQMPSHRHRIRSGGASGITDVALGNVSTQTVVGANRGNTSSQFFDANSGGQQFIENTGSGSTHNHSVPTATVNENSTNVNDVRPRSASIDIFQYVP